MKSVLLAALLTLGMSFAPAQSQGLKQCLVTCLVTLTKCVRHCSGPAHVNDVNSCVNRLCTRPDGACEANCRRANPNGG
jgi:hypothetical protein